jgi:uncharacterized membrane protein HdeD (DUF308 family)
MKGIRYTASILLLVSGVIHTLVACRSLEDTAALPILVFGIFYFIIGILLAFNLRLAPLLGVIFPLIGLAAGFIVIGVSSWTAILTMLFLADAVIIACCIPFLIKRKRL